MSATVTEMDRHKRSAKELLTKAADQSPKSFILIYRDDNTEDKDLVVINQTEDYIEMIGMLEYTKLVVLQGDIETNE